MSFQAELCPLPGMAAPNQSLSTHVPWHWRTQPYTNLENAERQTIENQRRPLDCISLETIAHLKTCAYKRGPFSLMKKGGIFMKQSCLVLYSLPSHRRHRNIRQLPCVITTIHCPHGPHSQTPYVIENCVNNNHQLCLYNRGKMFLYHLQRRLRKKANDCPKLKEINFGCIISSTENVFIKCIRVAILWLKEEEENSLFFVGHPRSNFLFLLYNIIINNR